MTLVIYLAAIPLYGMVTLAILADLMGAALVIWFIGSLLVGWMNCAVWAKRWHDRGKSGWWTLIALIPFGIGWIWAMIELGFLEGKPIKWR